MTLGTLMNHGLDYGASLVAVIGLPIFFLLVIDSQRCQAFPIGLLSE
jgi:hypothetical protein